MPTSYWLKTLSLASLTINYQTTAEWKTMELQLKIQCFIQKNFTEGSKSGQVIL